MAKHRKPVDIIGDILSAVKNYGKKTRIMYEANLSYSLLIKYLDVTIKLGLMKYDTDMYSYDLTDKGIEYLRQYNAYSMIREQLHTHLQQSKTAEIKLVRILKT